MNKVALVTGGGVRLGRAIALGLARAGFDVLVHANKSTAAAAGVASEIERIGQRAEVLVADLADLGALDALVTAVRAKAPKLALLVNNAGIYEQVKFEDVARAQLGQMLAVNLMAPFFLTQGVLPCLRAAGDACVVNITDMAVDKPYGPAQHMSHYLTAKAGLAALTRAWATELAPSVRVNAVAPGPVAVSADTTPEDRERLWRTVPLGREGSPDDVARAVVFFATGAPYVTGQTLRVDGGLSAC